MKYLYATAAVVVIGCGAVYLLNAGEQKRISDAQFCLKWENYTMRSDYRPDVMLKLPQFRGQENRIKKCWEARFGKKHP